MDTNGWLGQLVEQGMHDSACLLGEFLLAPQGAAQRDAGAAWLPAPTCETYVLYADALVGRGEQRRALPYLHQALQCARTPRGRAPAGSAADGSAARPSLASECEIKLRIARCYVALNESRNALACLMGIPSSARNASATLLLARLLEASGNHRAAASAHKEVLRGTPIVLESAIALAQLGTPVREIFAIQPLLAHLPWLVQLLHAHSAEGLHDATRAHEAFGALGAHFEGSTHVLLHTARAALFRGHDDEALALFQRARDADGNLVDGMDVFARGLAKADRGAELGRLCRELLFIDRRRPEPWGAVATYWTMRGEHARALEHCERALSIDERHPFAHQLKGSLLASLARPEQAVYAYRKANAIRADLDSFIGLVNAYLHIEKCREALSVAREAVQRMPNSARAHALLGSALCAQPNAQDKTKRAFAKALALDPQCEEAVMAAVNLNAAERNYQGAIELLQPLLRKQRRDAIHSKLGDMHALKHDFTQALAHYHHALALNASLKSATDGLERVEGMIRAVQQGDERDDALHDAVANGLHDDESGGTSPPFYH